MPYHTFFYSFGEKDIDQAHEFEYKWAIKFDDDGEVDRFELEDLAKEAAEDFVNEHDGWECTDWPYEFYFWNEDKKYLGKVLVDCELLPHYYGTFMHEDD